MVDDLMALCARAAGNPVQHRRLVALQKSYSDWTTLPKRAEDQGMAPLVYTHLKAAGVELPRETRRELLALTLRHRRANDIRAKVLVEILSTLYEQNIEVLVLKGAALANSVYLSPGHRPMRDMDILVKEIDVLQVQSILIDLGFKAELPPDLENFPSHHLPVAQCVREGLTVSLEVHHRLLPFAKRNLQFEELIDAGTAFTLERLTVCTLGYEDMLWHIYRHSFARPQIEKSLKLIWVADFISVVEKYVEEIDWPKVRSKYPPVWNILPLFHSLSPWSDYVLEKLDIQTDRQGKMSGYSFQGWPQSSLAVQRKKGIRRFLADTFWPPEWWMQLYYGLNRRSPSWWWARFVGHPLHILGWVLRYVGKRTKAIFPLQRR